MTHDAKNGLVAFLRIAEMDERLNSTHLGLFLVLYAAWCEAGYKGSFQITRRKIMRAAKMSIATYHKCLGELNRFGYLTYLPSFHPAFGSTVTLHFNPQID